MEFELKFTVLVFCFREACHLDVVRKPSTKGLVTVLLLSVVHHGSCRFPFPLRASHATTRMCPHLRFFLGPYPGLSLLRFLHSAPAKTHDRKCVTFRAEAPGVGLKRMRRPAVAGRRVDREVAWSFPYYGNRTKTSLEHVVVPASHTR
jgi:hypothetical protein